MDNALLVRRDKGLGHGHRDLDDALDGQTTVRD